MQKKRLDLLLVERNLATSRSIAQRLVMAGQVRVNGELALKPSALVSSDIQLEIHKGPPFISRGGEKLEAIIQAYKIDITGKICADVGASTGGFTDCLLQHHALRVYAIDVGKGILHWKLRQDPRVIVMEGVNARYLTSLSERVSLVVVDASFISLKQLLPVVQRWFSDSVSEDRSGQVIALIKPQFEVGRQEAARGGGVIRDPEAHRRVLASISDFAISHDYQIKGLIRSPLLGPKGNAEFLIWLENRSWGDAKAGSEKIDEMIERLFEP